ncbi:MAG TPA: RNA-binding protein [Flavobacteriales bacterium]|nr:RNA-binding protein [Flavobacteriales bacterium]
MRVDKFLWSVRLFKTRSISTARVKEGKVEVGGVVVKASRELKVGEEVRVRAGAHYELVQVLAFPKGRVGAKLVEEYIIDKTPLEERERQALTREVMREYPGKIGRPTKKERRNWEKWQR